MLKIENLKFSHPGQKTPLIYNLVLHPGKTGNFNGPSGCGKSTLLDLIAGFLQPTSGKIMLDGKDIVGLEPEQRPVSILFQSDNLFDHLSVRKNLQLGLAKNPDTKVSTIQNVLEQVGLTEFIDRPASSLSGGQKQRIALARTLLANQSILLLDEPYSSLDKINADKMRQLVEQLTIENNWHTLIVSHLAEDEKQAKSLP
ncbi:MAG: ATP-binding cassette domain-containing protein [Devosiaceae bacterium]|nr:ATP-binding cassette domain-containing protein [Devosiaceae bacterium]